jgi:four helix bundle protein
MQDLKARTKKFALDVIRYCRKLPRGEEFSVIKYQLIKAATSTAANYRASQRAKSKADFISKMGTVEEESDESLF